MKKWLDLCVYVFSIRHVRQFSHIALSDRRNNGTLFRHLNRVLRLFSLSIVRLLGRDGHAK